MGMLAKRKTSKRIEPAVGEFAGKAAFGPDQPWETHDGLLASAAIRSTLLGLGIGGAKSTTSGFGGWLTPKWKSTLWCVWTETNSCQVVLGVTDNDMDITMDWEMVVQVKGNVLITTESAKTLDGELVNGDLYDRVKSSVLESLAVGAVNAESLEAEATDVALALPVPAAPAPSVTGIRAFAIRPGGDAASARAVLDQIRGGVTHPESGTTEWRLGMPGQDSEDALLVWQEAGTGIIRGRVTASAETSLLNRRVTEQGVRLWIKRAKSALQPFEPEVIWELEELEEWGQ